MTNIVMVIQVSSTLLFNPVSILSDSAFKIVFSYTCTLYKIYSYLQLCPLKVDKSSFRFSRLLPFRRSHKRRNESRKRDSRFPFSRQKSVYQHRFYTKLLVWSASHSPGAKPLFRVLFLFSFPLFYSRLTPKLRVTYFLRPN